MSNQFKFQDIIDFTQEDNHPNYVSDGVYDVSNIEVIIIDDYPLYFEQEQEQIKYFEDNAINLHVAKPYETCKIVLMSDKPTPIDKSTIFGHGFNYGSCNMIVNCPDRILILAEND